MPQARPASCVWTLACAAALACGGPPARSPGASSPGGIRRATGGRPPLATVIREGDPRAAVAVAVTTDGVAPDRAALAAVSLAGLVRERLAARGIEARAVAGWGGWRLSALVGSAADASSLVTAVRAALVSPVAANEPALAAVARQSALLAERPLPAEALGEVATCTGEPYGAPGSAPPTLSELEAWRSAAHGTGRVALATAGPASIADAVAAALARGDAWPPASPAPETPWPPANAPAAVYDASGEVPPGAARVVVTARTPGPERAVAAAAALGTSGGPLISRLAALTAPGRLRSVAATAHPDGGCLAATIDLSARDLTTDAAARIATAAALARQEIDVEIADAAASEDALRDPLTNAPDPRDAAERAAWWTLAGPRHDTGAGADEPRLHVTVGLAPPKDATAPAAPEMADAVRSQIDRATLAWKVPVVDARVLVERGQGELWLLVASPCGTTAESAGDAGLGAAVVMEAAAQAGDGSADALAEPFIAADGLGVLVHGRARDGEPPTVHARRLADLAARTFEADPIDLDAAARARTRVLVDASRPEARSRQALAAALEPVHPSWIEPRGTMLGVSSASNEALAVREAALRAGPIRVAVLANTSVAQAEAASVAVDRWIARRPGESRTCPSLAAAPAPRAGIYAVAAPPGAFSEAWLALPLAAADPSVWTAATWFAAALDGPDGILARALGGRPGVPGAAIAGSAGRGASAALARSWGAALVGARRSPALVVRVAADDDALDAAVAQVRGVLDHLRRQGLSEDETARATASVAARRLSASLDPRARVVALWRGEAEPTPPPSDALRAFAASTLRDESLVVVASRPRRPESR
jgi:hypothetical protein